ncbi:hypothetical protein D9619_010067 [Psilocybe cf. subviscida]|uniref:F-box domain-containing protein n=1 Tax=Psilocybe cf. subviscida TaxID=2480587 RepID=A0A8H5BNM8_9AGAR|nr:hypothetical protein D9619_010067 [Psilocybe cf. subviscida]
MSPEQAQRLVDDEIRELTAKYVASLSQLKARRNLFSAISKLPNEVLLEIFMTVKDCPSSSFKDFHGISQICQRWRHLVLDAPAFWTRLSTSRHEYTMLMLHRSKLAPLDVHLPRSTSSETLLAVLDHLERIRTLSLTLTYVALRDLFDSLSKRDTVAPLMETLCIVCGWYLFRGDSDFALSLKTFGLTSCLHTLKLAQFPFDFVFPHLPNVTHLDLGEVEAAHNLTGIQLTRVLRQVPNLEVLIIGFDHLGLHDYTMTTPPDPIQLSHLTSLDIKSRANRDHIQWFLMQVSLPALQRLNIDAEDEEQWDYIQMVKTIGRTIAQGDFGGLDTLKISYDHFKISSQHTPSSANGPYVRVSFAVGDIIAGGSSFNIAECIVLSCTKHQVNGITSSPIQYLRIGWLNLDKDELHELLGNLPDVEAIETEVDVGVPFVEALTIPFPDDSNRISPNSKEPILDGILPKLEVIALRSMTFHELSRNVRKKFFSYLSYRYDHGKAIKMLGLDKQKLSASEIKLLAEVVDRVEISDDA